MHQRRLHAEVSTSKLQEQAHPQQTAESSLCSEAKADSANGVGGADAKERRGGARMELGWSGRVPELAIYAREWQPVSCGR